MSPWSSARLPFPVWPALCLACVIGSGVLVLGGCGERPTGRSDAAQTRQALDAPWTQQAKLVANQPLWGSSYGQALAISGDIAVIGGAQFSQNPNRFSYVVERSGSVWTERQILQGSSQSQSYFGSAVAVSGDTVVVGSAGENNASGAAYVFARSGDQWKPQQRLGPTAGTFFEHFGCSLAVEGDTLVVGTCQDWYRDEFVYVFVRTSSTWTLQQKLKASDPFVPPESAIALASK